jgi:HEAT repeat protein
MNEFMIKAQTELNRRFLHTGEEMDVLEELLKNSGENRLELLKWVMKDRIGDTFPRVQAGLEFMKLAPEDGWEILVQLISSNDPDDRDTASWIFEELNDPRSYPLMKPLLDEKYPSMQFDACDFLMDIYPKEVEETLKQLAADENKNVREAAQKRLDELNQRVIK